MLAQVRAFYHSPSFDHIFSMFCAYGNFFEELVIVQDAYERYLKDNQITMEQPIFPHDLEKVINEYKQKYDSFFYNNKSNLPGFVKKVDQMLGDSIHLIKGYQQRDMTRELLKKDILRQKLKLQF